MQGVDCLIVLLERFPGRPLCQGLRIYECRG
jgi:hypothetical protein